MRKTPIRKVSKKMAVQKVKEAKLKAELLIRCNGCCEYCGRYFGKALQKHEVKTRGQFIRVMNTSAAMVVTALIVTRHKEG